MMQRVGITPETTVIGQQREEEETSISLLHDHDLGKDIKIEIEMITIIQAKTETDLGV